MAKVAAKQSEEINKAMENQEWWWVAEKKRSSRLDYLRKAVWKKGAIGGTYNPGIKVDIERPILFTEAWKENDRDPQMLRKAKALAEVFKKKTIFITDHAQLVGYAGGLPNSLHWLPEGASMVNEELYNEPSLIPEPQDDSLKVIAELTDYWAGKTAIDRLGRILAPEDLVKFMSGVIGWGTPSSAYGYSGKDYEYILTGKRGFEDIIEEINNHLDEAEKRTSGNPGPDILPLYDKMLNWEAMQIILEACIINAERYARLARIIADNFETDPKRKEELLRISETCQQVPAKPPRNLQESFQLGHFIQVFARHEAYEGAMPCRPDYYHGPYYDKDVNIDKRLTKEEALDLVGEFMIRTYEIGLFAPRWAREGLQGITGTWVWTMGGVNKDGSDACNDLTIAFMQAARLVRVSNPTFGFRWHPEVKDEVMRECFECLRHGLGYPSMRNDPILIENTVHWYGHPIEEARTWVHQACMSPCPPTKHGFQPMRMASATANCAKMIEYALSDGYDRVVNMQMGPKTGDPRKFNNFEELFQAWVSQMEWLMNILVRTVNLGRSKDPELFGRPFLSSISERSVESGIDAVSPIGERGNCWVTFFTWVENADSLAAVKKLVFDEKKYTMDELITALEADWEGYEEMRLEFVRNAPKWGNDDDYVDNIMVRCLREVARHSHEIKCPSGNNWPALPENVSGNIHYASLVGALPNGRRLGDALYDGGISPGPGLDKKGPTAVLKSCSKFDHVKDGRAFLLNQRLSPTQMAGENGYKLWNAYMKTWADLGLDHVQFNMVDDKSLRAAQKDPEKYSELIVRVAGYSAHFVDISRKTQDNIIQRTVVGL
ncbi:MAG: formate acetyltransferase [Deltaproteobacteria bacterium]|nr:formate acetyltransferase [Deltaproteobacteria bacterium]